MKVVKLAVIAALVYVGIVVAFESMIGFMQPTPGGTVVLTTLDASGTANERVVSRLDSGDQLYVSANHWPRAWYERALANPDVQITVDGAKVDYRAVPVDDAQAEMLDAEHPHPAWFRFVTGYPPRDFLRLEPRQAVVVAFETTRAIALRLPGVAEGTWHGTPAFRVRRKDRRECGDG